MVETCKSIDVTNVYCISSYQHTSSFSTYYIEYNLQYIIVLACHRTLNVIGIDNSALHHIYVIKS
jgi:hypothetical protein